MSSASPESPQIKTISPYKIQHDSVQLTLFKSNSGNKDDDDELYAG